MVIKQFNNISYHCVVRLVAQSCPTLCNPMNCSPPGSSVHGDSPGKNTAVGCHALLQGIFPTQGLNPGLPHCRQILYHLSHQGSPLAIIAAAAAKQLQSRPTLCDPMTAAHQAPPSLGFSRQEHCSGLPLAVNKPSRLVFPLYSNSIGRVSGKNNSPHFSENYTTMVYFQNDKKQLERDFPGSPVAKTQFFQCREPGFDPWSGALIPYATTKDPACCNKDGRSCMQ